jgi:hypothetical protein
MTTIKNLSAIEYNNLVEQLNKIALYNKQHFFSNEFFDQVLNELKNNLRQGLSELLSTNTYTRFINLREKLHSNKNFLDWRVNTMTPESYNIVNDAYQLALTLKQRNQ